MDRNVRMELLMKEIEQTNELVKLVLEKLDRLETEIKKQNDKE